LLQDASVLGKTFTRQAVAALSGRPEDELEPLLASLVRKEVLGIQSDPRSPELGQYGFLQDLVRHVAYDTLSKKDRKSRHLAIAAHLEKTWGAEEDEIVEVIASHFVDAYRELPDAPDASELKRKAGAMLSRAGERAAALGGHDEAERYFTQAAELTDEPTRRAELHEQAGIRAWMRGHRDGALSHYEEAIRVFEDQRLPQAAARVSARMADLEFEEGRIDDGIERMEASLAVLTGDRPDAGVAALRAQLARMHSFRGNLDRAAAEIDETLQVAESQSLVDILCEGLITKALVMLSWKRPEECEALLVRALKIALEHDLTHGAFRAYNNLCDVLIGRDRYEEAIEYARQGVALARRIGNAFWENFVLSALASAEALAGAWDEALEHAEALRSGAREDTGQAAFLPMVSIVYIDRGLVSEAREILAGTTALERVQQIAGKETYRVGQAALLTDEGRPLEALKLARDAFESRHSLGTFAWPVKEAFVRAVEAAFKAGDLEQADELIRVVDALAPGEVPPLLQAHASRFRGRLAAAQGGDGAEGEFKGAIGLFRELGTPFWLGVTLLEYADWLQEEGRDDDSTPLLDEAASLFDQLDAAPWLERVRRAQADASVPSSVAGARAP
jgi:tetratricopeptide (TPR) repeat protein